MPPAPAPRAPAFPFPALSSRRWIQDPDLDVGPMDGAEAVDGGAEAGEGGGEAGEGGAATENALADRVTTKYMTKCAAPPSAALEPLAPALTFPARAGTSGRGSSGRGRCRSA